MLGAIWNELLVGPILNILIVFYRLFGNLGIAIIVFTLFIRAVLIPVTLPSIKSMKKQRELAPELEKLKKKHQNDKQKMAQAQMELLKKNGINPASGCITQLPMIFVLIAVYSVIRKISLATSVDEINFHIYFEPFKILASGLNTKFLYLEMAKPDPYYILAVLSGIFQFFTSKLSFSSTKKAKENAKKTPDKNDDLAYNIQEQMLYVMPITSIIVGLTLPSGVVLHMVTSSLFSLVQTYLLLGKNKNANKDK